MTMDADAQGMASRALEQTAKLRRFGGRALLLGDSITKRNFSGPALTGISRTSGVVTATTATAAATFYVGCPVQIEGQSNNPSFPGDFVLTGVSGTAPNLTFTWAQAGADETVASTFGNIYQPTQLSDAGWFIWANAYLGQAFDIVHNSGYSGDTTTNIIARVARDVYPYDLDYVFLCTGENDILNGDTASTAIANVAILGTLLRNNTHATIVLMAPPPCSSAYGALTSTMRNAFAELRYQMAEYCMDNSDRFMFADTYPSLVDPLNATPGLSNTGGRTSDGIHMSAKGAQLWGLTLYNKLSGLRKPDRNPIVSNADTVSVSANSSNVAAAANLWTNTGGTISTNASGALPAGWTGSMTGGAVVCSAPAASSGYGYSANLVATPTGSGSAVLLSTGLSLTAGQAYAGEAVISLSGVSGSTLSFVRFRINLSIGGVTTQLGAWGAASSTTFIGTDVTRIFIRTPEFTVPVGGSNPSIQMELGFSGSGSAVTLEFQQFACRRV